MYRYLVRFQWARITTSELTLIAAWEFADDATGAWGVQTREYDLDGGLAFIVYDADQAESR